MQRLARIAALALALAGLTTAVAFASGGLSGTFKTTIKHDSALGGQLNGTWTIKFGTGTYKVRDNGNLVITGTSAISGSQITLSGGNGPAACAKAGTYKYKLKGAKLTFTKVKDSNACAGREGVLSHTFTKVS